MRYPLPVDREIAWRPDSSSEPRLIGRVPLPAVPAGHLVAASFASSDLDASFRFRLESPGATASTGRFGPDPSRQTERQCESIAVLIDCFGTRAPLEPGDLVVEIDGAAPPAHYLVVVAVRPVDTEPSPAAPHVAPVAVPCLSQTVLDERIRAGACSPTCVAMVMAHRSPSAAPKDILASAAHAPSGLLGVWPQNLWAAARHGLVGGVELLHDWHTAAKALDAAPIVASIRFGEGELRGAPIDRTGGHLVVVRGISGGRVLVNDPAAPPGDVARSYDLGQFTNAWFRHRGAAYVFSRAGRS